MPKANGNKRHISGPTNKTNDKGFETLTNYKSNLRSSFISTQAMYTYVIKSLYQKIKILH